jgi:hypothetical protein
LNLEQGIYILDGAGFDIQSGDLNADGVLIYVIGTGVVHLGGDGQLTIRSPNPGPHNFPGVSTFEGVSIFLAHDNTNAATIDGSNLDLEGTYYFPSSHLNLMGNGNVGNLVIADTTAVSGDGEMTITYDDRFPPLGNTVFLVK